VGIDLKPLNGVNDVKALSVVLATLIIIAVTITVSIIMAFWMGGLTGFFMGWERLEISNAFASRVGDGWDVTFTIVNRGVWDSRFTGILVNDKPIALYGGNVTLLDGDDLENIDIAVKAGTTVTITIHFKEDGFHSGQTVLVTFQSARGGSFPREIHLP
jgi:hypothetical protein